MDSEVKSTYLFIGGTGRSGTNITRKIFSQHPDVASFPFEYRFIIDPDGVVDFYQSITNAWSPYMTDVKIKRLQFFLENLAVKSDDKKHYQDWELSQWFPRYESSIKNLISELKDFEYSGFWPGAIGEISRYKIAFSKYKSKEVLAEVLGNFLTTNINDYIKVNNKRFFVEDNTWNILFAKELSELMPQSKMLHLIRDPRDVIASFMEQRWCPNDFEGALKMYKSIITKWFDVLGTLPPDYCKVVKLENLVAEPEKVIREICAFSGIPFDLNLLGINLTKSNFGRWKSAFTDQNVKVVEEELREVFQLLNYIL